MYSRKNIYPCVTRRGRNKQRQGGRRHHISCPIQYPALLLAGIKNPALQLAGRMKEMAWIRSFLLLYKENVCLHLI